MYESHLWRKRERKASEYGLGSQPASQLVFIVYWHPTMLLYITHIKKKEKSREERGNNSYKVDIRIYGSKVSKVPDAWMGFICRRYQVE